MEGFQLFKTAGWKHLQLTQGVLKFGFGRDMELKFESRPIRIPPFFFFLMAHLYTNFPIFSQILTTIKKFFTKKKKKKKKKWLVYQEADFASNVCSTSSDQSDFWTGEKKTPNKEETYLVQQPWQWQEIDMMYWHQHYQSLYTRQVLIDHSKNGYLMPGCRTLAGMVDCQY